MSQHPTKEELSGFLLGKLAAPASDVVAEHIDECPPCQNTLSELSSQFDTLVKGLQKPAPSEVDSIGREAVKEVAAKAPQATPAATPPVPKPQSPLKQAEQPQPSQMGTSGGTVISRDAFRTSLISSGIFDADDFAEVERKHPPVAQATDGRELARALVQCGALSKYQATAVYQGKLKGLVYGEYAVVDLLGEGGMGQVFKARHRSMDRIVALKVLAKAAVGSPDAVKRFQREVKAAAKLIHPNIVTAFDASKHDGTHYLVMEFVPGSDLSAVVKKHGPLPIAQAVNYTIQAARGLAFAHSKGVVHRDIKPANLLVDGEGVVKILDMGLARLELDAADAGAGHGLTQTGQIMGTVDYMAPEQAFDTSKADAKADVYSLGCTLYRLLTGGNVFGGDTLMQKLLAHREQPAPSLRTVRPDVSADLDAIYLRMMAKQPQDRPTMTELIAELEALDRGEPTTNFVPTSIAKDSQSGSLFAVKPITTSGREPQNTISLVTPATKPAGRGKKPPTNRLVIGAAAAGAAALCLWGIIVLFKDPDGNVIAEASVPNAASASVVVAPDAAAPTVTNLTPKLPSPSLAVSAGLESSRPTAISAAAPRWPYDPPDGREYVWSAPENLGPGVNGTNRDMSPRLTDDELTLIFNRDFQLFTARRSRRDEPFAAGERLAGKFEELSCEESSITGDGLELFLSNTGASRHVWLAKRAAIDQPFGDPVRLAPPVNVSDENLSPVVSSDGLRLAIYSPRGELQIATRFFERGTRSEPFREAAPFRRCAGLEKGRVDPVWFSADGRVLLTMVLHGDSWPHYWHVRASSAEQFSPGMPFGEPFVGNIAPGRAWVSPDGQRMYFHSREVPGGQGNLDLWMVRRVPKPGTAAAAPPTAVAPFDAATARAHQEAWAGYLGMKVQSLHNIDQTMVLIPPGEFLMGSTDEQVAAANSPAGAVSPFATAAARNAERPRHKVVITKPFLLSVTEVTNRQFKRFVEASKYVTEAEKFGFGSGAGEIPSPSAEEAHMQHNWRTPGYPPQEDAAVTQVSWNDAAAYCRWLSEQDGATYRLPTEAEWEYACRAGTTTQFSFGDKFEELPKYGWFFRKGGPNVRGSQTAGTLLPNAFGLFDMHGSVLEWCRDFYSENYYGSTPEVDPSGPTDGLESVCRGGSWYLPEYASRTATRWHFPVSYRCGYLGFRVVREVAVPATAAPAAPAIPGKPFKHDPAFPKWMNDVQAMPADQQIEAVRKKLVELNPGFDGKLWGYHSGKPIGINRGVVVELGMSAEFITDISPVQALSGLKVLTCNSPRVRSERFSDLSPLAGMQLGLLFVGRTAVRDLTPLKGMPISELFLDDTQVSDLSPLVGLPLLKVTLNDTPVSDLTPLNGCKSLKDLHVKRTKVTPAAIAALRQTLPNCRIEADAPAAPTLPAAPTGAK